jgi:hypothetical protein
VKVSDKNAMIRRVGKKRTDRAFCGNNLPVIQKISDLSGVLECSRDMQ